MTETVSIGRSSRCTMTLRAARVSRIHCKLEPRDYGYLLLDMRSSNGTWVDGRKIDRILLQPGDCFSVGEVTLRIGSHGELTQVGGRHFMLPEVARRTRGERAGRVVVGVTVAAAIAAMCFGLGAWYQARQEGERAVSDGGVVEVLEHRGVADPATSASSAAPDEFSNETDSETATGATRTDVATTNTSAMIEPLRSMIDADRFTGSEAVGGVREHGPNRTPSHRADESATVAAEVEAESQATVVPHPRTAVRESVVLGPLVEEGECERAIDFLLARGRDCFANYHIPEYSIVPLRSDLTTLLMLERPRVVDGLFQFYELAGQYQKTLNRRWREMQRTKAAPLGIPGKKDERPIRDEMKTVLAKLLGSQLARVGEMEQAVVDTMTGLRDPSCLARTLELAFDTRDDGLKIAIVLRVRELRLVTLVPSLIDGLSTADIRVRATVRTTLEELTGQRLGDSKRAWREWWDQHGNDEAARSQ